MYHEFPISVAHKHWQKLNRTSPFSRSGSARCQRVSVSGNHPQRGRALAGYDTRWEVFWSVCWVNRDCLWFTRSFVSPTSSSSLMAALSCGISLSPVRDLSFQDLSHFNFTSDGVVLSPACLRSQQHKHRPFRSQFSEGISRPMDSKSTKGVEPWAIPFPDEMECE